VLQRSVLFLSSRISLACCNEVGCEFTVPPCSFSGTGQALRAMTASRLSLSSLSRSDHCDNLLPHPDRRSMSSHADDNFDLPTARHLPSVDEKVICHHVLLVSLDPQRDLKSCISLGGKGGKRREATRQSMYATRADERSEWGKETTACKVMRPREKRGKSETRRADESR
jgi:hypothetical protein